MSRLLLTDLDSSAISRVVYDVAEKTLYVEFKKSNAVWRYLDVPNEVHNGLIHATSAGAKLPDLKNNFDAEKVGEKDWLEIVECARKRSQEEIDALMNNANEEWLSVLRNSDGAVRF